jgi:predicted dehydrogenase
MSQKIKWGILATGRIAHTFATDLKHSQQAELYAVGSRSQESADAFAKEYNMPKAYASYEALAQDPDVQIIYIATPHPQHLEAALTCMKAGKAVLCEKPIAVNSQQLQEMINCAKENNVFLMEAMWTRFLPTIQKVREWLQGGAIGDVSMLKADFGFRSGWNPEGRLLNKELGGGALLDVGIYCVSFASWVFGKQPSHFNSFAHIGKTGVDEVFTAAFDYGSGQMANLSSAVRLSMCNDALLLGTEGRIKITNFHAAKTATLHRYGQAEETYQDQTKIRGYIYQAEEAMRCLQEGLLESPQMPWSESLAIMQTMDKLRQQWGLSYPMES